MANETNSSKIEYPRERLSPISTADGGVKSSLVGEKPRRASVWQVFGEMPWLVKFSALWLILTFGIAIYAKLDVSLFDGALPLQDPNFQTNGFDTDTGEFGIGEPIEGPSTRHWLGTDAIARDTFARIAHGAWVSLIVAAVAAGFGLIVGGFLGSLVGFVRGRVEAMVMATIDVILRFRHLFFSLPWCRSFGYEACSLSRWSSGCYRCPLIHASHVQTVWQYRIASS